MSHPLRSRLGGLGLMHDFDFRITVVLRTPSSPSSAGMEAWQTHREFAKKTIATLSAPPFATVVKNIIVVNGDSSIARGSRAVVHEGSPSLATVLRTTTESTSNLLLLLDADLRPSMVRALASPSLALADRMRPLLGYPRSHALSCDAKCHLDGVAVGFGERDNRWRRHSTRVYPLVASTPRHKGRFAIAAGAVRIAAA